MRRIEDFLFRDINTLTIIEIEKLLNLISIRLGYDYYEDIKFFMLEKRKAELIMERMIKIKALPAEWWGLKKTIEYCDYIIQNFDFMTRDERGECYEIGRDYAPSDKDHLIKIVEARKKDKKWLAMLERRKKIFEPKKWGKGKRSKRV